MPPRQADPRAIPGLLELLKSVLLPAGSGAELGMKLEERVGGWGEGEHRKVKAVHVPHTADLTKPTRFVM